MVCDSVIFDDVVIGDGAKVNYTIIDSNVSIGKNASVGVCKDSATGVTVLGSGVCVDDGATIGDNEMISDVTED